MLKQNLLETAPEKGAGLVDALLSEHFINGRRVGLQGQPSSLVQGRPGSPEYDEGLRGWRSAQSDLAYSDAMWSVA